MAWRDYWQKKWQISGNIDIDLKTKQHPVLKNKIPSSIIEHCSTITAIDKGIKELYETGYMHNHLRMYTAAICCNIGQYHWLKPAKWMYYHLLDGDWGSNALSWQWVAGTNSHKKYIANQENINKYQLNIDINSKALKNKMIEVNTALKFEDTKPNEKKSYYEIIYTAIVKVNDEIKDKKDLEKIILCDVPTKIYPDLETSFLNLVHNSSHPNIKLEKKIDFEKLYNDRLN